MLFMLIVETGCRNEWRSQQPVRSASLESVMALRVYKASNTIWASCHQDLPCSGLLLTRTRDKRLVLINADTGRVLPLQLPWDDSFPPWNRNPPPHQAFMGSDGLLRVVEPLWHPPFTRPPCLQCHWHTIHPLNGHVLRSAFHHMWFMDADLLTRLRHAKARLALSMPDALTLLVMDEDTLQEVCRISMAHSCTEAMGSSNDSIPDLVFGSLEWAAQGDLLAVSVQRYHASESQAHMPQIRIHSTASGQCLQSIELEHLQNVRFSWSESLDLLVVCWASLQDLTPVKAAAGSSSERTQIMLLDPFQQTQEEVSPPAEAEWRLHCHWTPCGGLLVTGLRSAGLPGICVLDVLSRQPLYTATFESASWSFQDSHMITWSQHCRQARHHEACMAYLPERHAFVHFDKLNDQWHVRETSLVKSRMPNLCSGKTFAPDGSYLVGVHQLADGKACLCNWDSREINCFAVGPAFFASGHGMFDMDWVPFPPGWSPMHACILSQGLSCAEIEGHLPSMNHAHGRFPCIHLVDAKAHQVLESWMATDLFEHMKAPALRTSFAWHAEELRWAPNSKHLAVLCNGLLLLLIFKTS